MLPEPYVGTARALRRLIAVVAVVVVLGLLALRPPDANAALPVGLGTADSFGVPAGEGVTNTGFTVINGDLGTHPNPAVTGFPPGIVNGAVHQADAAALQAQSDLATAYNDAAGGTITATIGTQLGGQTLVPGVYNSLSGTCQYHRNPHARRDGRPRWCLHLQFVGSP